LDPSSTYAPLSAGTGTAPPPTVPICATADRPRTLPLTPPTSVSTTPVAGTTERILKLFASPTSTLPTPSRAAPMGLEKAAPVPAPSYAPGGPNPATDETAPVAMTSARSRLLWVSHTYSVVASAESAMPRG